ncbi:MAG: Holliday junction branch migration protein RuvA [Thermanaerothrix sp.]|jgi:Holliday junction DNA helicase RuvA|uniref:Holliday junction branch migration complex subunit RuvA n=3 Tax=Thermanaerothrix TaxID=1077886 RepID=A0ABU3NL52_9CHLR|nr:Holliday junction branch migration protein RuvA [Thermanaerothrix sp. 4228-RoL]MDT8897549.1 Holliday junction branch migration protein RuvA [Thermanaerothrix sp. 4228-RoL]
MIAFIEGEVAHVGDDHLVLRLGGLGLQVFVPTALARQAQVGVPMFLHTHLVVREDGWALYGFESEIERHYFTLLLGVNGVGPRLALAILSALSVGLIQQAVHGEQPDLLARVPGVGRKTAQKIILYLQDKIGREESFTGLAAFSEVDHQVLEALTHLGYSVVEAQAALQSIPRDAPADVEERLRLALQHLAP